MNLFVLCQGPCKRCWKILLQSRGKHANILSGGDTHSHHFNSNNYTCINLYKIEEGYLSAWSRKGPGQKVLESRVDLCLPRGEEGFTYFGGVGLWK